MADGVALFNNQKLPSARNYPTQIPATKSWNALILKHSSLPERLLLLGDRRRKLGLSRAATFSERSGDPRTKIRRIHDSAIERDFLAFNGFVCADGVVGRGPTKILSSR